MAAELKRSPSFSFRKSLDSSRFRRKHADSLAATPGYERPPPPPLPTRPRANTTQFDSPESQPFPRLSKRTSIKDFWKHTVAPKASLRQKRGLKTGNHATNHGVHEIRYRDAAMQMQHRDVSADYSCDVSIRSAAYSGSDTYKPLAANPPPPSRMATIREPPQLCSLREADLRRLFQGAPSFAVVGHKSYPRVQTFFRDEDPDRTLDHRDCLDFPHRSLEVATMYTANGTTILDDIPAARDIVELPNMLDSHGLEPGTVGLEHFCQLAISQPPNPDYEVGSRPSRLKLFTDPSSLGIRPINIETCMERLTDLSDSHVQIEDDDVPDTAINEQRASEMYSDLFSKLLTPPRYSTSSESDPTGLNVQIAALVRTLSLSQLWYDFSLPYERLRLGRTVWVAHGEPTGIEVTQDRDCLLLQITLAAELLIRLRLVHRVMDDPDLDAVMQQLPRISRKVAWDLVLAKRFLSDVRVVSGKLDTSQGGRHPNRSSLFSMMSFVTAREDFEEDEAVQPILLPRHEQGQLEGLLCFANALDWPHARELRDHIKTQSAQEQRSVGQGNATPVDSPTFRPAEKERCFDVLKRSGEQREDLSANQTHPSSGQNATEQGMMPIEWLSRSWLTGLVLPGDSASQSLLSALLESSPSLPSTIGQVGHLASGFVYQGKSYWSKTCTVGRVLSALDGSRDCMNWLSVPCVPLNENEGWIDVLTSPPLSPSLKPRIKDPRLLSSVSTPFPDPKTNNLTDSSFTWPTDGPPIPNNELGSHVLAFESSPSDTTPSHPSAPTLRAMITFTPPYPAIPTTTMPLAYSVNFLCATPCFPRSRTTPASSPRSPNSPSNKNKALPSTPCHPLLNTYLFQQLPALALLDATDPTVRRFTARFRNAPRTGRARQDSLAASGGSPKSKSEDGEQDAEGDVGGEVLVLDARDASSGGALQLLARAWCASIGADAVVGRCDRSCVGCCVREARGVGAGVVIRI